MAPHQIDQVHSGRDQYQFLLGPFLVLDGCCLKTMEFRGLRLLRFCTRAGFCDFLELLESISMSKKNIAAVSHHSISPLMWATHLRPPESLLHSQCRLYKMKWSGRRFREKSSARHTGDIGVCFHSCLFGDLGSRLRSNLLKFGGKALGPGVHDRAKYFLAQVLAIALANTGTDTLGHFSIAVYRTDERR